MAASSTPSFTKSHSNVVLENEAEDEEYEKLSQECKELLLSLPREKGLTFAIVNRNRFSPSQQNHPLLTSNAHDLVPFFEFNYYGNNQIPSLSNLPEPRLFGTHVPFHSLPDSIMKSKCKIIYISRNPFDHFVSFWVFINKVIPPSLPKLSREEAFERFEGDINFFLKRVAEFLGIPFNSEEESNGVIESIIELCRFEKMKELEANKNGKFVQKYENKHFFRKGEVGDWVNHFSPWMEEKLSKVIEDKLGGSGFSF
ncbi:hypothetical protein K1719_045387 [Acacia pycnantha]|nr:hypothetical protein K1719_045387 [Acacia pycnantha]